MSDFDPSLLEALGNLVGIGSPADKSEGPEAPDEDLIGLLERAENLANGLDE